LRSAVNPGSALHFRLDCGIICRFQALKRNVVFTLNKG
jgi:hypothetical protein